MFDTLIASASRRPTRGSMGMLSLALHASLITGAVLATRTDGHPSPARVRYVDMDPPPTPSQIPHGDGALGVPGPIPVPVFEAPTVPPLEIPPLDGRAAPIPDSWLRPPGGTPPGAPGEVPYLPALVDEAPEVLSGPPLDYPELLRQAGIAGRVVVEVVVDTTGRAELGSIRVVTSAHPAFARPAREFVAQALFRPARVGGRAVRVLVRLPIDFTLRRR